MVYENICNEIRKLRKRCNIQDPFYLCSELGIIVLLQPLGTDADSIKGFYLEHKRIKTIIVNSDLPEVIQKIIVAHELGHAILHKTNIVHAFHDVGLFDESNTFEKEANLFAAELLLEDEQVFEILNTDCTFFTAAATLNVPSELLDFKFRIMKQKGYKLIEPPINARNNFLKNISIPPMTSWDEC